MVRHAHHDKEGNPDANCGGKSRFREGHRNKG